jgi:undecaprenyl diphosphate synthase
METDEMRPMPGHVAFIMDGNGRWAKKRGLPRTAGHKAGGDNIRKLLEGISKMGIKYVTIYAFSTENWNRPKEEVDFLMNLMEEYLDDNLDNAERNDYRLKVIGRRDMLTLRVAEKIEKMERVTADKTGLTLTIALSYGGRDEIVRATKNICAQAQKGAISNDAIDEKLFSRYLDTYDNPDPDLIVRTSGEMRTSNCLIWQGAYAEYAFSEKLWPDYTIEDFKKDVEDFRTRDRRFGK